MWTAAGKRRACSTRWAWPFTAGGCTWPTPTTTSSRSSTRQRHGAHAGWATGAPGWRDGAEPRFYEPGGLSGAGERLYVADTNNHVIRVVDLASATVATLALADPDGLLAPGAVGSALPVLELPPQEVRPGPGRVRLLVDLPAGLKLNRQAASRLSWQSDADGVVQIAPSDREALLADKTFPYDTPATFAVGSGVLRGELTLYYCEDEAALCLIYRVALAVPVTGAPA